MARSGVKCAVQWNDERMNNACALGRAIQRRNRATDMRLKEVGGGGFVWVGERGETEREGRNTPERDECASMRGRGGSGDTRT